MGHVDVIAELITEGKKGRRRRGGESEGGGNYPDVDCLEHLTDVTCTDFPDGLGRAQLSLLPQRLLHNAVLTEEVPNLLTEDEPIPQERHGDRHPVEEGQVLDVPRGYEEAAEEGGPRGRADEDEADAVEEAFDHDYDVSAGFPSHLIRKAVLWFTGEAMMEDDYDEDDGMMGGEEEEERERR
ncbi:LOW QUALITY PROTEIN: hypothetical protein ACHAW5_004612 [Stephanodiscus triporus]|uniref:Uncharacterized protein n=1 Tax=Stephanodiscus triporus TaxID=2934178 RepID=A0ABD3QUZ4_9STRA